MGSSLNKVITTTVIMSLNDPTYFCGFSEIYTIVHGITPICSQMSSIDSFADRLPLGCKLKGGLFDPGLWLENPWESGVGPFGSPPMGSY